MFSYKDQKQSQSPRGDGKQASVAQGLRVTEDEVDAMIDQFASSDEAFEKTWSRRVVEYFFMHQSWYFPRLGRPNAPSLSKAWAYYEHITLPRHFVGENTAEHVLRLAEPGEKEDTELYNPARTPQSSLIEWGIGIDLYFSSLRIMAGFLLIAGLINLPNILFYASDEYSRDGKDDLSFSLKTSMVCTTFRWVVCQDCVSSDWSSTEEEDRFGIFTNNDGITTTLVLKNECDGGQLKQGIVNWATLILLIIGASLLSVYLRAREIRFDEDKLTSTDYSLVVKNPPSDAYDPEEWRDYFTQFADKQVTAVTIALDNDVLLRKLIERRIHMDNLRKMLPKGTDMDNEDVVRGAVAHLILERESEPKGCITRLLQTLVVPFLNLINKMLPPQVLVDKAFGLKDEIRELQKEKYNVTHVYVTFETEEGQRAALASLAVSRIDLITNNKAGSAPSTIFHDRILKVEEPTEPSAVRWLDLSASTVRKLLTRTVNLAILIGLVGFSGLIVSKTRESIGPAYAGPLISILNSIIPQIVKLLMIFERHTTEGSFQVSLYLKITLFRWVNTAILTQFITPFTSTVSDGDQDVLISINAILWSELWLVPGLRLLDIMGNLKKHVLAPRANTQAEMNLGFQGTFYNLGERYTDLTKVLFVVFFYSALYPLAFFFGAAILFVQYYTDKYCLMRIWASSSTLGGELARFSRRYFFSGALLAMAIVSAYAYAQFPYDNLCMPEVPDTGYANQVFSGVVLLNGNIANVTVERDESVVFCNQNWREYDSGIFFPPTSRIQPADSSWMKGSQDDLTDVYGWTALAVLVGFILVFFGGAGWRLFMSLFRGVHEPDGQKQQIDFSCVPEIFLYVPQIKLKAFPFPFLACNIDTLDQEFIGWSDPSNSYDFWNLSMDVEYPGMPRKNLIVGNTRGTRNTTGQESAGSAAGEEPQPKFPIYSIIKSWPPAWQLDEIAAKRVSS